MPLKNANKRIFQSIFWIYFIASLVTFYFLYEGNQSNREYFDAQIAGKTKKIDSVYTVSNAQQRLIEADNFFIAGNYDTALFYYEELAQVQVYSQFPGVIELRLNRMNEMTSNRDTLFNDLKSLQYLLSTARKRNDSLTVQLDTLNKQFTSNKRKAEDEIFNLQRTIKDQDAKLAHKDKVKVISFRNEKGNLVHYLGEVKEGMANGGGVGIFDTGGIYKGEWKNNQRHGSGTYEWKDGHKYDGQFVNGEREGQGTYVWSSGEKYVGQWKAGKRNGQGTLYDKDNNVSYEGLWLDDKIKK